MRLLLDATAAQQMLNYMVNLPYREVSDMVETLKNLAPAPVEPETDDEATEWLEKKFPNLKVVARAAPAKPKS